MKKPEDEAVFGGMHSTSSNFIFVFMILPTLNVFRMSLFEKVHIHRMKHLLA